MIVFNTNQLNHFGLKNTSQQKSTNFNSYFNEKVTQLNDVEKHASKKTSSPQNTNQPLLSFTTQEKTSSGTQYFKQQLSLMAKFAIRQYETFANIEKQNNHESILGINEYA